MAAAEEEEEVQSSSATMKKAERAEGEDLSLSVFASRADRCDVQTKSGIRRMARWDGTREGGER